MTALLFFTIGNSFRLVAQRATAAKGLVYRLHATSTPESAASDPPVEPLDIPDFLLPKTGGFLLPDEDEVLEYLTPPPAQEPSAEDSPSAGEADAPPPTIVPQSQPVDD